MRRYSIILIAALLGLLATSTAFSKTQWQTLAPGLTYTQLPIANNLWGRLHAFKIDPNQYQFRLVFAKDHNQNAASVKQMALANQALIAVNGGFFTPTLSPIGLRISNGKVYHSMQPTSWWGIFYLKNNRPGIMAPKTYQKQSLNLAVQGGPRLIVDGRIPRLKPGIAQRTAVGITTDNQVIIAVTENAALTTTDLATMLAKSEAEDGLACVDALNLDGGSSTQAFATIGDWQLSIPGIVNVTDALIVQAKP